MSRKKNIKRMMALGFQRNDAQAFFKVLAEIDTIRKRNVLRDILYPVPEAPIKEPWDGTWKIKTQSIVSKVELQLASVDVEEKVKRDMAYALAESMLRGGIIRIDKEQIDGMRVLYSAVVEVTGNGMVLGGCGNE